MRNKLQDRSRAPVELDGGVEDVRVLGRDGQADSSHPPLGQSLGQLLPATAAVDAAMERRAGAASTMRLGPERVERMRPSDSHDGQRLTFRIPRLEVATLHRRGSLTLPRSPCAHAAPTTPAGDDGHSGRFLPPTNGLPHMAGGSAPARNFRGLLRVHSRCSLRTCLPG